MSFVEKRMDRGDRCSDGQMSRLMEVQMTDHQKSMLPFFI